MCSFDEPSRRLLVFRPDDWLTADPWGAFKSWQAARAAYLDGFNWWPSGHIGFAAEETQARLIASSVKHP